MSSELQSQSIETAIARAPAQCDIGPELPTEIMQDCFRKLDFRGRIVVSHVSRGWRAVALNDRNLWNEAAAPYTGGRCGAEMLRALLARSDPLPFSFSWDRPYGWDAMPEDVAELVCSNMHRMRACAVSGACLDLVWQPAPMLGEFDGQEADGPADLASRWPGIKLLWLRSLSILPSAPQRFAAVVLFSCWEIAEFAHARTPLFSVFPALETLSIGHIMQEEVGCLSNPPDCLVELSVGVVYSTEIDYAPVLCACHRLQSLHHARDAAAIVELFSESARAPWLMEVYGRDEISVELRDDAQSRVWCFTCGYGAGISFIEPRLAACLTLLGHLAIELTLLVRLHNFCKNGHAQEHVHQAQAVIRRSPAPAMLRSV